MPKLYLGEALGVIAKTLPFLWVRLASYLVLGVALLAYFGVVGGIAYVLGRLWAPLGFLTFLVAIGGGFGILRWASRYYFYLLKAAHTAVMTEVIVTGSVPSGSQLAYGRAQVTQRFRDTSVLFGVDLLVDGIVKAVIRTFTRIASILPLPGVDGLGRLLERIAVASTTFIDEAVLSRAYKEREDNVWSVAEDGVVLYAQAWKPILANAVVLALLGYAAFLLFLIVLGLPAAALGAAMPWARVVLAIGVIVLAWMLKLALADTFSLATTLLAYHRTTEGLAVDEGWKRKLEGASDKFRELGRKAREAVAGTPRAEEGDEGNAPSSPAGTAARPGVEQAGTPSTTPAVPLSGPGAAAPATAALDGAAADTTSSDA